MTTGWYLFFDVYFAVMWNNRRRLMEDPVAWHFIPLKMLGHGDGWIVVEDMVGLFFLIWGAWLMAGVVRANRSERRRDGTIS